MNFFIPYIIAGTIQAMFIIGYFIEQDPKWVQENGVGAAIAILFFWPLVWIALIGSLFAKWFIGMGFASKES